MEPDLSLSGEKQTLHKKQLHFLYIIWCDDRTEQSLKVIISQVIKTPWTWGLDFLPLETKNNQSFT